MQVKHLNLSEDLAEDVSSSVSADRIVIVCKDAEKRIVDRVCNQLGISGRIQAVITQSDLVRWYDKALRGEHANILAQDLLESLRAEFADAFPSSKTFEEFYRDRQYNKIKKSEQLFYEKDEVQTSER